jgi:predicted metal-dependent hydrolase
MEAMDAICDRAGRKLRDMVESGQDCSDHFTALRGSAAAEFLADTPDVSADQPDMIDWLRHGAEQAELEHLAYAVQDILGVSLI